MKSDLSGSQVKALFIVAAQSRRSPVTPYAGLLGEASKPAATVQELQRIKEQAKELAKEAADRHHREAAQLLYHVAVAAAFVRHGSTISSRPMRKQHLLYEKLAATWKGHAIGRLFRDALARVAEPDALE